MLRRHGCAWWRSLQRRSARLTRRVTEGPHPRRLRRDLGIALRLRSLTQVAHSCVFDPFALEHLMPQRRFRHLRLRVLTCRTSRACEATMESINSVGA